MNQTFLRLYQQLTTKQPAVSGLWLAHGDEPLMSQWLLETLQPIWQKNGQMRQRIDLTSSKSWQSVLTELNSLSLFDPANAIIVSGNHKPDTKAQQGLAEFSAQVQQGVNTSHLIWLTAKQDKRALNSKWIQVFTQQGMLVDCHVYNEQQRLEVLQLHAKQFGVRLTDEAWQLLISHTQNNLLTAYQSLWRLSFLLPNTPAQTATSTPLAHRVQAEDLQIALVSQANYSVFDLSDAMLNGNAQQVVQIINSLQQTREPSSLVLWTVAKDMRLIQQLCDGKSAQAIGIWRNKERLYQQACHRQQPEHLATWSGLLYRCDQAIKGVIKQPVWELLLQAALCVCGVRLFA